MRSAILITAISRKLRKFFDVDVGSADVDGESYGVVFFGTPHGGPGNDWKIAFGKASVSIAHSLPGVQSNDIMEGLKSGSLFSDALQSQWRHQLSHYQIVTFYEGIGNVRNFLS